MRMWQISRKQIRRGLISLSAESGMCLLVSNEVDGVGLAPCVVPCHAFMQPN
uniref:Pyridoxamine 5'-phosphate oxidase family protein n=1 Tax=Ascaris lumbricoides TaxID=6252 RepID=A0A0M3ILD3_ASCLU